MSLIGMYDTAQEAWDAARQHGPGRIQVAGNKLSNWLRRNNIGHNLASVEAARKP